MAADDVGLQGLYQARFQRTTLQHQSLTEDGRYIYVGNFLDSDISILRVDGDQIVYTGKSLALPGHPASMRGRTR